MSKDHDFYHDHSSGEDDQVEFSVIAISEDLLDVELVLFEDRVGEYAGAGEEHHSMFRQAETIILDIGVGFRDFGLHVFNTTYKLFVDSNFLFPATYETLILAM